MPARVTNTSLFDQSLFDIQRHLSESLRIQEQLSTGRRVNRASDDPAAIRTILDLRADGAQNIQHRSNIEFGSRQLEASSTVLDSIISALFEVQDVAGNFVQTPDFSIESPTATNTLNLLLDELVLHANEKFLGNFLFGGTQTLSGTAANSAAFNPVRTNGKITSVVQNGGGVDGQRFMIVDQGERLAINVSGSAVFQPNGSGGTEDLFDTIIGIRDSVEAGNLSGVNSRLAALSNILDRVATENAKLGSRIQSAERLVRKTEDRELIIEEERSVLEDTDVARAIIDQQVKQATLEAAFRSLAQRQALSLMNFI